MLTVRGLGVFSRGTKGKGFWMPIRRAELSREPWSPQNKAKQIGKQTTCNWGVKFLQLVDYTGTRRASPIQS